MFELTINDTVYQFNFGIGFVRDVNKTVQKSVDGFPDVKEDVGVAYKIAQIIGGDVLALIDVLDAANKGKDPRVTKKILEEYIEDEDTDIDKLFSDILSFFKKANATKRVAIQMEMAMAEAN